MSERFLANENFPAAIVRFLRVRKGLLGIVTLMVSSGEPKRVGRRVVIG